MKDHSKTKKQLLDELAQLRQRVAELEGNNAEGKFLEEAGSELKERLMSQTEYMPPLKRDISDEELAHIIDFRAIQELMDFFYKVTKIGVAILDLEGNILVATGWQDICTRFHRVQPQSLQKLH